MNEMFTMSDSDMNTTTTTKLANKPKKRRKLSFTQCKQITFGGGAMAFAKFCTTSSSLVAGYADRVI